MSLRLPEAEAGEEEVKLPASKTCMLPKIDPSEFELLKIELSILKDKITSVVDTLWKVRTTATTLWVAVLGVGLGGFTDRKEPVAALLGLSCFLPIVFHTIDARYNRWYRRVSSRDAAIQGYLNGSDRWRSTPFPIYDPGGRYTFSGKGEHQWDFSLYRSMIDPIPCVVYGGQLILSSTCCWIYWRFPYGLLPTLITIAIVTALLLRARALRRTILRDNKTTS